MRQTNAAATILPFKNFKGIVAAALPEVLRYATQFVTLFPPPSFVRAAPVSCMPLRSFRPRSASLHPFVARHFASGHDIPPHRYTAMPGGMHIPFAKPALQYTLGSIMLHYVLHSLQSHPVHPLPSVVVLALRPPPALRGSVGTVPRS